MAVGWFEYRPCFSILQHTSGWDSIYIPDVVLRWDSSLSSGYSPRIHLPFFGSTRMVIPLCADGWREQHPIAACAAVYIPFHLPSPGGVRAAAFPHLLLPATFLLYLNEWTSPASVYHLSYLGSLNTTNFLARACRRCFTRLPPHVRPGQFFFPPGVEEEGRNMGQHRHLRFIKRAGVETGEDSDGLRRTDRQNPPSSMSQHCFLFSLSARTSLPRHILRIPCLFSWAYVVAAYMLVW